MFRSLHRLRSVLASRKPSGAVGDCITGRSAWPRLHYLYLPAIGTSRWQSLTIRENYSTKSGESGDGKSEDSGESKDGSVEEHEGGPEEEEEDEFEEIGFGLSMEDEERERARAEAELRELEKSDEELTPEMASDLVKRMVSAAESATKSGKSLARGPKKVLEAITPDTIRVLAAMRVTTNKVVSAGSQFFTWPIEKKVVAYLDVEKLHLSDVAEMALQKLVGPRWDNRRVKLVCVKFPTSEENQAHVLWMADRLVASAKTAVGESVNSTPIEGWSQIMHEVEQQISKDPDSAGILEGIRSRASQSVTSK